MFLFSAVCPVLYLDIMSNLELSSSTDIFQVQSQTVLFLQRNWFGGLVKKNVSGNRPKLSPVSNFALKKLSLLFVELTQFKQVNSTHFLYCHNMFFSCSIIKLEPFELKYMNDLSCVKIELMQQSTGFSVLEISFCMKLLQEKIKCILCFFNVILNR